jgi:hypothetical protein
MSGRVVTLVFLQLVLVLGSSYGQAPRRAWPPRATDAPEPDARGSWIINPVFATGMKCDGFADDSAALQTVLNSATYRNATIIMPPGTCLIDTGAQISINAPIWLQGSGRFGTTLKRKNSSGAGTILKLNSNGITLSDFAIDGNKGGTGISAQADSIAAFDPFSNIAVQHMRFLNSTNNDIVSYVCPSLRQNPPESCSDLFTADWLIEDNEFVNQSNPFDSCVLTFKCANIRLLQPLRCRIIGNRSINSQAFVLFGSVPGGGQVEVGSNIVTALDGFGVALGGGALGSAGAHVHHNFFSSTNTNVDNLIDLAFWSDFIIDHNTMYHNGVPSADNGLAIGCVGDFPPANHGEVDSNICYIAPNTLINIVGIGLGGSDVSITNNFVQGASSAGISIAVSNLAPSRGVRIIGNTSKNNNQNQNGAHAGIELYLGVGGAGLSGLSDVVIQGNHVYDDQPTKTQAIGIGVGLYGQRAGFQNVIIEGNDVAGNKTIGIYNNADPYQGFVIRNNFGYNPLGNIPAPTFPASGVSQINNTTSDVSVYVTAGTQPISVMINGVTLAGVSILPNSVSAPIRLPANQSITLTYAPGGAPTWQWIAD